MLSQRDQRKLDFSWGSCFRRTTMSKETQYRTIQSDRTIEKLLKFLSKRRVEKQRKPSPPTGSNGEIIMVLTFRKSNGSRYLKQIYSLVLFID